MAYEIITTPNFERDIEFYYKKRKYKHIEKDISPVLEELEKGNLIGDEIPNITSILNEHTYKVRVANTDTNVGKSNGYRLIYYAIRDAMTIYLLALYYKKDDNNIPTNTEIIDIINKYCVK